MQVNKPFAPRRHINTATTIKMLHIFFLFKALVEHLPQTKKAKYSGSCSMSSHKSPIAISLVFTAGKLSEL